MYHRMKNEEKSQPSLMDLGGGLGGIFIMFAGALESDDNPPSYLLIGGGFICVSYFFYSYIKSTNISFPNLPINFHQRSEKQTVINPPKIKKPINPVLKNILQGEKNRQENKKKTWSNFIRQILTFTPLSLIKKKQDEKTATLPVEPIEPTSLKEISLKQQPLNKGKAGKLKLERNKPTKKNFEKLTAFKNLKVNEAKPTKISGKTTPEKTNLKKHSTNQENKDGSPKLKIKKKFKTIENPEQLLTISIPSEIKNSEPPFREEDKQDELMKQNQQLQIEQSCLEQESKKIDEQNKVYIEEESIEYKKQLIKIQQIQQMLPPISNPNKNENLNQSLIRYAQDFELESELSAFPPSMPMPLVYRLSENQVILLPNPRSQTSESNRDDQKTSDQQHWPNASFYRHK